ncbi:hypothetical protein G9A89_000024 [Geosiphon pyriformis]|nr:hypothetical protein G9A89_000024 [Geosiphon pyriformis]
MNNSLAYYVFKVEEISSQIISVQLLFKGKLSVMILGLYTGASPETRFNQALEVNFLIAKAVNSSTFVVLGENFNENRSGRSASYKFCLGLGLGLVNSFATYHLVCSVSSFFNTNHNAVMVLIDLSGLLDAEFRDCFSAKLLIIADKFFNTVFCGNVDDMNKHFSKFFGLELLVAKIVRTFSSGNMSKADYLTKIWSILDDAKAHNFTNLVCLRVKSVVVLKHLLLVCKEYKKSKMYELKLAKKISIRKAIAMYMENFCSNKVVDDELVLEPEKVKLGMNKIYVSLDYVKNNAFSGVMDVINMSELLLVVGSLPNNKAAGLSSILNELWKHSGENVLGCLLVLLNTCLIVGGVPALWKKAWVSMIFKPYD